MRFLFVLLSLLLPMKLFASTLESALALANGATATIFGVGELSCHSGKRPKKCEKGLYTASGEVFDPDLAQAAIVLPVKHRMRPIDIWLKLKNGPCTKIRLNDKKSEAIKGKPWDITPGAVRALGAIPTKYWSAPVYFCTPALVAIGGS